ncbi:HTH-type transcriptional regulator GbpR [Burkholderiales bacterium 8X]|nr:HTH-type transcriptional regulator GbpR [Burkholderiales bacterium 8X]
MMGFRGIMIQHPFRLDPSQSLMPADPGQLALNLRRLRLRHLEILLALDRHGSLTATADAMGVSQPAMSQWLAEIEAALGVPLYLRGRQLQATPYLPAALRHARHMVADSNRLQLELESIAAGSMGLVRIGSMGVGTATVLPRALIDIRSQAEPLAIEVVEDIAAGLWARFERREIELILCRLDERAFAPHLRTEALFKDPHCVVVGPAHPMLAAGKQTWAQAALGPWILPPRDTALRRAIDSTFLDHGLPPPEPWLETASGTLIQQILQRTECLAVTSGAVAARAEAAGLLGTLRLRLNHDVGPVGMVWDAQEESPALQRVLQALRRSARTR